MLLFLVDYAEKRQLCSLLCSFSVMLELMLAAVFISHIIFLPFILYAILFVSGSVSAPFSLFRSRAFVPDHSRFACTLFYNVAPHHKVFPENLSGDVFCVVY